MTNQVNTWVWLEGQGLLPLEEELTPPHGDRDFHVQQTRSFFRSCRMALALGVPMGLFSTLSHRRRRHPICPTTVKIYSPSNTNSEEEKSFNTKFKMTGDILSALGMVRNATSLLAQWGEDNSTVANNQLKGQWDIRGEGGLRERGR